MLISMLIFVFLLPLVSCQEPDDDISFRPDKFLEDVSYDKWSKPENGTAPLTVYVRMFIYFLGAIEAQNLQFTAHVLIRYRWKDERLSHDGGVVEGEGPLLLDKIWTPHIYVVNEQESKIMGSGQDILININKDGTVHYSTRMKITLLCLMNLKKFPFDYQMCPFVLESWGYNSSQISLEWETYSPVTINNELELTEYTLASKTIRKGNNTYIIPGANPKNISYSKFNGNYSSLTVYFRFEREIGHYIMDYYVPSMLLVVVSWVSFWLDPNAVPGRTTLGTSTMLTFITLSRNIGSSLPKVSYIKATEIWFIVCTGFIFGSLVEFAFVNTIWRRRKNVEVKKMNSKYIWRATLTPQPKRKEIRPLDHVASLSSLDDSRIPSSTISRKFNSQLTVSTIDSISRDPFPFSSHMSISEEKPSGTTQKGFFTMTPQEIAQWIDRRSRIFFPCSFIVFNLLYWVFVYIDF